MGFNFKKVSAIGASVLLTGMSLGVAAAANYPSPFVVGGSADAAIVYGTGAGVSSLDLVQAGNIQSDLQSYMGSSTDSGDTTSGETYPLFTSSSKIWMNDTLDNVRSIITKSELPTVLADGSFQGAVDGTTAKTTSYTQTVEMGSNPRLEFGQHPTTDDDPIVAFTLPTTASASSQIFNLTVTFAGAINFTDSDSTGEKLTLFGKEYTVGSSTDTTDLYLLGASDSVSLEVGTGATGSSSTTVTVDGEEYTVQLVTATSSDAKIKLTDSSGSTKTQTISQDESKTMLGVDVTVTDPFSSTAQETEGAEVSIGTGQLKLTKGNELRLGADEDIIDGTNVIFGSGEDPGNMTSLSIQFAATSTDEDAVVEGGEYVDTTFGAVKVLFSGLNIPRDSSNREDITVKPSGIDKATVEFTNYNGETKSINWYYNVSTSAQLGDSLGNQIVVREGDYINKSSTGKDYVVVGNENEGYLLQLSSISNSSSSSPSDDTVEFKDVFSGDTYSVSITNTEGSGTMTVGGKQYTVTYVDDRSTANDEYVTLDYPDSSGSNLVIYPTIQTSEGAKFAFYEPITLDLNSSLGSANKLRFPDGDGYSDVTFTYANGTNGSWWDISGDVTSVSLNTTNTSATAALASIGQLTYEALGAGANSTTIRLRDVGGTAITLPSIVLFEEQDDANSQYEAMIVKMEGSGTSSKKVGVEKVEYTWGGDFAGTSFGGIQLRSDTDIYEQMDLWGTLVTIDQSDSDAYQATISYPDEQVYAKAYIGEEGASVTSGTTSGGSASLGDVLVKDSEVSSVSSKNLVVVGGSCINSAAASLVGGAYCGSGWTDQTNVGSGQFLIQSFGDSSLTSSGKIALLVAGYEAADTVNAATYLRNQVVDTTAGKKYIGTSSTSAELQVS